MKKIIILLTLMSALSTSVSAESFEYELTDNSKDALFYGSAAIVSVAAGEATFSKTKYNARQFAPAIAAFLTGLGYTGVIFGIYYGASASYKGIYKIDKVKLKKSYESLKLLVKSFSRTGQISNPHVLELFKKFSCANCASEKEKINKFSNMFTAIDDLALMFNEETDLNVKNAEEKLKSKDIDSRLEVILGEDASETNIAMAKSLLAIALVNFI